MIVSILLVLLSIVILYFGAEFSLEGAEKTGKAFNLSPLIIGMFLVGFGTSLPEFFVTHIAAQSGEYELAIGGLLGSNMANILLILGASSLMTILPLKSKDLKLSLVIHFFLAIALFFVLRRSVMDMTSVLILEGLFIGYFVYSFMTFESSEEPSQEKINFMTIAKMLLGFILLYIGGNLLVSSGTKLALDLGISTYVVSAIFIAFGTSFPELVTSLIACVQKKDQDLIIGNIIGSNLFNCAFILGTLGFYKFPLKLNLNFEVYTLLGLSLLFVILSLLKKSLNKVSGVAFLLCYGLCLYQWL